MANCKRLRIDSDNTTPSPQPIAKRLRSMAKGKQKQPSDHFKINWADEFDHLRSDRLLIWLDENPTERHRLFSDSAKTARQEDRSLITNKSATQKTAIYARMAEYIFKNDRNVEYRQLYAIKPEAFASSVLHQLGTYVHSFQH
jgi:hypothetical protein